MFYIFLWDGQSGSATRGDTEKPQGKKNSVYSQVIEIEGTTNYAYLHSETSGWLGTEDRSNEMPRLWSLPEFLWESQSKAV